MAATDTDGWLVLHDDRVVAEEYLGRMPAPARRLRQSVSESVTSAAAGSLVGEGVLDPAAAAHGIGRCQPRQEKKGARDFPRTLLVVGQ